MKYFLTDAQASGLILALRGRSERPLKFSYLKEGAKNWDRLVRSPDYGIGIKEINLLMGSLEEMKKVIGGGKFNLVDMGPGNADKTIPLAKHFQKSGKAIMVLIDISHEMMHLAEKNIRKEIKSNIKLMKHSRDFEEGNFADITKPLKKKHYPNNFIILLGNTVGNQFDRYKVLLNARESMSLRDYLLIGIELRKNTKDIAKHYRIKELKDVVFSNLKRVGLGDKIGKYGVGYNKRKHQVEVRAELTKNATIKIKGEKIELKKGNKILLLISYKTTPKEFRKILKETGFKIKKIFKNKGQDYALVLCQPIKL